jgi:lysophospholipase L1-like esterase
MSLRSRLLAPLALVVGSVLVTLLALEVGFRLAHVSVGTVQINRATVRPSANPRLRFELKPGAAVQAEVAYRVNSEGLRGPEVTVQKPEGVRRVALLGDSIAFGYWVADEDGLARQLESMLNDVGGGGPHVEVLNFGVPGYNLDQEIETLRSRVLRFDPDVVVLAFCLNDLEGIFSYELGLVQDRATRRQSLLGRLREGVLSRSYVFAWIEYRLAEVEARRRFVAVRNPLSGPLYEERVEGQKEGLRAKFNVVRAILAPRGIEGVVAVFPSFTGAWDSYPHASLHRVVTEAAGEAGLIGVDLLECYAGYHYRAVRVDVVHPSPLGHRVAAHALRDALCAHHILCPAPVADGPTCRDYHEEDFPTVRGY